MNFKADPTWDWIPANAQPFADALTGPDHVVRVTLPNSAEHLVVLEQKMRFGKDSAIAGPATYLRHLKHKTAFRCPDVREDVDGYLTELNTQIQKKMFAGNNGEKVYRGTVPQVCMTSLLSQPSRILIKMADKKDLVVCQSVGFLSPVRRDLSFLQQDNFYLKLVRQLRVRLWIGLDSLLRKCTDQQVQSAWNKALKSHEDALYNAQWKP